MSTITTGQRRWLKWASLLVLLVAVGFFSEELINHFDSIPDVHWDAAAWLAMVGSIGLMLLNLTMGGLMWKALLRDQGAGIRTIASVRIVCMSQVAKYLPGNVGHLVGQVGLANAVGVPVATSITTMLISTLWLAGIGLILGMVGLLLYIDLTVHIDLPELNIPLISALGLLTALSPWIGIGLLNRWLPKLSRMLGRGDLVCLPTLRTSMLVGLGFLCSFFVLGLMMKWQAVHIFGVTNGNWVTMSLLFASAWTAGYLLPGAPGGLGVREAIAIALFTPILGAGPALGLSITMRLATTMGDGLAFVLALWLQRLEGHPSAQ